jgi:DNA-binding FadR family transcriptional regulator
VAHKLATDIIGGTFAPGSILPNEDNASASFGVSRSAYREAVRTLAAKGLVMATPKIGTRISPRSSWRLLDPDVLAWHLEVNCTTPFVCSLFEMRKVVEPSAAALAAIRRTEEDLSRLATALEQMARLDPGDAGWHGGLLAFHDGLLRCCDNEVLAAMWPAIQVTLQWGQALQMSQPNFRLVSDPVADHAKVFEKIAAQSAEDALQEMAFLIDAALADTIANLARMSRLQPTTDPVAGSANGRSSLHENSAPPS